jgi:predicted acetyltransferase
VNRLTPQVKGTSRMSVLTEPNPRVHASFLAALREYHAEGAYTRLDPADLADPERFRRFLDQLRAQDAPGLMRRRRRVPQTRLWLTEGEEYLGELTIRHRLNRRLRYKGGHIGYRVRPTRRRRGHATLMLGLSLPVASQLGIDPALITCDDTNVASRRVIEANGGSLASASDGILRFWVPTAPRLVEVAPAHALASDPHPAARWSRRRYGAVVVAGMSVFFVYTGLEVGAGQWEASFSRGVLHLSAGATGLAALGPAVTVLALIVVAFELVLNRPAPIRPH